MVGGDKSTQGQAKKQVASDLFHGIIPQIGDMNPMDDKITIVEGPPPTFEPVGDIWTLGLNEGTNLSHLAITRLRTFNGKSLLARCQVCWNHQHPIHLVYRQMDGMEQEAPIVAARNMETPEGDVLLLWVRVVEQAELEIGYEDDGEDL
jgi:hypothetical protein